MVAIGAGPATNLLFAVLLFWIVLWSAGGKATTKVDTVFQGRPAHTVGLQQGDRIIAINGTPMTPSRITQTISGSGGKPVTLLVSRGSQTVVLGPIRPKLDEGVYRLGFQLGAEPLGPGASVWESVALTGRLTREIGVSLGNIVHKAGPRTALEPDRDHPDQFP